jgi:hypothetical protein
MAFTAPSGKGTQSFRPMEDTDSKLLSVLLDAWFTSKGNLKAIAHFDWFWIGEIKRNRLVSLKKNEYLRVERLDWTSKQVHKVWLKAYGFIVVSKIVATNGGIACIATNDLSLGDRETIKNHYAQQRI